MNNVKPIRPFVCCENSADCTFPCPQHPWHHLHMTGGIKPSMMLTEADLDRIEEERYMSGVGAIRTLRYILYAILFYTAMTLWACSTAHSMDHGFDKSDPTAQWFESLKRPDDTPPKGSCCGFADAYGITIIQDAVGDTGDEMGEAIITDGAPKTYPDGALRVGLPNGLHFRFPKSKVNPLSDGNPTGTAWLFVSVNVGDGPSYTTNNIRFIYCVVPLPPGY
jgi:hypothetical protein